MNVLLIGMPAHWEDRLREVLSERGHTYRIINDVGEIATAREQANQPLVFLGVGETIDKANDVCRQLRRLSLKAATNSGLRRFSLFGKGAGPFASGSE